MVTDVLRPLWCRIFLVAPPVLSKRPGLLRLGSTHLAWDSTQDVLNYPQ